MTIRAHLSARIVYFAVAFALVGCGAAHTNQSGPAPAGSPVSSPTAPAVSSSGQQVNGDAPNRIQSVQFTQAMDPSTITAQSFYVTDATGARAAGAITYNAAYQIAGFTPNPPLRSNATYTLTVTTAVTNMVGVHLAANYTSSFTTRPDLDLSPVYVASVTPAANSECVDPSTPITITFSEGIDPATLNTANVTVTGPGQVAIPIHLAYDEGTSVATVTPQQSLPAGLITVVVQNVADAADVPMQTQYGWQFSTNCSVTGGNVGSVLATIDTPAAPAGLVIDEAAKLVYVTAGVNLLIIDESSNAIIDSIPVSSSSQLAGLALDTATSNLYIGGTTALYVFDTRSRQVSATLPIPAVSVGVNIDTNKVYVSNFNSTVYVVDGATNSVLSTIPILGILQNLAVNSYTNRVYAAVQDFPGQVVVIDGNSDNALTTVNAGGNLTSNVAVDISSNLIYTADEQGTVSVIDGATNKLTKTIQVPGAPAGLAVDQATHRVYVTNGNELQVIDGAAGTLIGSITVGPDPQFDATDSNAGLLYVGNVPPYGSASPSVTVVSTH